MTPACVRAGKKEVTIKSIETRDTVATAALEDAYVFRRKRERLPSESLSFLVISQVLAHFLYLMQGKALNTLSTRIFPENKPYFDDRNAHTYKERLKSTLIGDIPTSLDVLAPADGYYGTRHPADVNTGFTIQRYN